MLTHLFIRHYAIIPELELSLQPGLTIITGETGAGKSILLGALGLALGKRADSRVLPDENLKCIVEARFELKSEKINEILRREGLDTDSTIISRREISAGGKSRSFINDTPVPLKVMQEIAGHLIELHHQHDNLALQSRDYQVNALDTLSSAKPLLKEYQIHYDTWQREKSELLTTREMAASSERKKDFLEFQIRELETAQLKAGEMEELESIQNILQHAETVDNALEQMQHVLTSGPHSVMNQLIPLIKQLESIRHVSSSLSLIADRIENLRLEVQDLALEGGRMEGLGQKDPNQLQRVESRLTELYNLVRKYHVKSDTDLALHREALSRELSEITSVGDRIGDLEKQVAETRMKLIALGQELSQKRSESTGRIINDMNSLLKELGMPNGRFSIEINSLDEPRVDGMDDITFLFSANQGMPMQPLHAVASGGELSRLSLALKSLYAAREKLPTIIFDEIDTGISGEVAWRMGQLIKALAEGHQVVMITHSPQIAAHASTQYHVSKKTSFGKDISAIELLTKDNRLVEIAKMLSGDPPSKEALANAKSLVKAVQD
jgi:DNA repair protein RecN (Recombination protein N)